MTIVQGIVCLYEWKLRTVTHPAKFGGHRPCGRKDIKYLILQVILLDHAIKELCDFMEGSSWLYIPTPLCQAAKH